MIDKRSLVPLFILILLAPMPACGQRSAQEPRREDGYDGIWLLLEGEGPHGKIDMSNDITLEIDGGEALGGAACNSYFGRIRTDGTRFLVENIAMTEIGCKAPLHETDDAYRTALLEVRSAQRDRDRLVLTGSATRLSYEFLTPPPDAPLVDTSWRIDSLVYGRGPAGSVSSATPASLRLDEDGSITGSTGCRSFSGEWQRDGEEIVVERFSANGGCKKRFDRDQDQHLVSVLNDRFAFEIHGLKLEVVGADGELGAYYYAPCDLEPELRCRL